MNYGPFIKEILSFPVHILVWGVHNSSTAPPCRLPSVSVLNGSKVTDEEREDAERFFIRYHLDYPEEELPYRCDTQHTWAPYCYSNNDQGVAHSVP